MRCLLNAILLFRKVCTAVLRILLMDFYLVRYFFEIAAYKVRDETFDFNHHMNTTEKLWTMVNNNRRINFDDGVRLLDVD